MQRCTYGEEEPIKPVRFKTKVAEFEVVCQTMFLVLVSSSIKLCVTYILVH